MNWLQKVSQEVPFKDIWKHVVQAIELTNSDHKWESSPAKIMHGYGEESLRAIWATDSEKQFLVWSTPDQVGCRVDVRLEVKHWGENLDDRYMADEYEWMGNNRSLTGTTEELMEGVMNRSIPREVPPTRLDHDIPQNYDAVKGHPQIIFYARVFRARQGGPEQLEVSRILPTPAAVANFVKKTMKKHGL